MEAQESDSFAFREANDNIELRPQTSYLALWAMVCGVISVLSVFSNLFLPASVAAIALGAIAMVRLSRSEGVRGIGLAQIGAGAGAATLVWALVGIQMEHKYLYSEAGKQAADFLKLLSEGETYRAIELTKVEPERQVTGVNLELYYQSLREEDAEIVEDFLSSPTTVRVIASGPNARWELSNGINVAGSGKDRGITVEMVNRADAKSQPVIVELGRKVGILADDSVAIAHWHVSELTQ